MKTKKVSIIAYNLSSNALVRPYVLAELLEPNFEVEILGPKLGKGVWNPISREKEYIELDLNSSILEYTRTVKTAIRKITGDVTIAVKPTGTSFGVGLLKKVIDGTPLILDLDDWETAGAYEKNKDISFYTSIIPHLYYVNSLSWKLILERLHLFADEVTVSNTLLRERLGGNIIVHGRNTEKFKPSVYDNRKVRKGIGIHEDETVVMFSGTPRPHKGVEFLIEAHSSLKQKDITTVIVGSDDNTYAENLKKKATEGIQFCGTKPFSDIPKWIAACDIFVVPQRDTLANRGQIPAKVFDAMAMGKPVVATEVGDLPRVLDGCGVIVEPDSSKAIASALDDLYRNPEKRETLGAAARKRCVEQYSYKALAPKMKDIVLSAANSQKR
jgi:glycosyltransferase involved in cell wall biosynthesis